MAASSDARTYVKGWKPFSSSSILGMSSTLLQKNWLDKNHDNDEFMYPGLDEDDSKVTCYRWNGRKQTILFKDIEPLIAQIDTSLDERSSEEFSEAFMVLMS